MSLSEIIRDKEAELRQIKDHEVAVVFDAFGEIIIEEHGGGSSVDLGPYIAQIQQVDGATLAHNHPLGWQFEPDDPRHAGNSFSSEDIETACYAKLSEIRAICPVFCYSARPAKGLHWDGDYWISMVQPALERHKSAVVSTTLQAVREHDMSEEVAEARFWHEVWQRVANDLPIVYKRFQNE